MCSPEQCWSLVREPNHLEPCPWLINNAISDLKIGRKLDQDKVCNGQNVSRRHLQLVRSGDPGDWRTVRWSVLDLGGLNGTFLNKRRIQANQSHPLNCNDLLGIGCPDGKSTETTFVYRVLSPQAMRGEAVSAEAGIAGDAVTPPHPSSVVKDQEDPSPTLGAAAGPSQDEKDESLDSPPRPVHRKRRRSRHLLSSSEDDDEETKDIKRQSHGKKRKEDAVKKKKKRQHPSSVKCRVNYLHPPPLSVGAQLDAEDNVSCWLTVSTEQYKKVSRTWAGLDQDGSQGTPLQIFLQCESESEEEYEVGDLPSASTSNRGDGGDEPEEGAVNFSLQEEIIELLDSNDEEEYNNSQHFFDEIPPDPESDRSSPSLLSRNKNRISLSEEETSDLECEEVEENYDTLDDEDEIQILNESQNSLYYKITKTIKTEPIDCEDPALVSEQSEQDSSEEEILPSEREFLQDVKSSIVGADEKLVLEAYRKIKIQVDPDPDEVIQMVSREVEDLIVKKLSKEHRVSQTQVKILLLNLKGDTKEAFIREADLKKEILVYKETNSLLDEIVKESDHPPEKVREAMNWLKLRKLERTKANVLSKLGEMKVVEEFISSTALKKHLDENIVRETVMERINENEKFDQAVIEELLKERVDTIMKIESIKASVGCSEELARNKLFENDGNTESASQAAEEELNHHRESKQLAEKFNISVSEAKETRIEFDEYVASQALEEENSLSDVVAIEELLDDDDEDDFVVVDPAKKRLDNSKANPPASSLVGERRRKLKEIAESKKRRREEKEAVSKVPTGIMKTSVPKSMKLSMDLQNEAGPSKRQENSSRNKRQRHQSDKASIGSKKKFERRNSVGFLEEEAKRDLKEKKEKYRETPDGYKTLKKLSVHNVDYNIMSQDISKMPVPNARPFTLSGMEPSRSRGKKKLRWKDENGFEPLVDIWEIEAANRGVNCGPGNKDREFGRIGKKRKPVDSSPVIMEDVFKVILDWRCVWLDEQKKTEKPPPTISGHFRVLPLLSTFNSMKTYVNIFIPLMIRELWSVISKDYMEREKESIPIALREMSFDQAEKFTLIRCLAVLTYKDCDRDFDRDGWLARLDLRYEKIKRKINTEIKPCLGYIMESSRYRVSSFHQSASDRDRESVNKLLEKVGNQRGEPRFVLRFTVKCKQAIKQNSSSSGISMTRPTYMKLLSRVKPELRKFEALVNLEKSPLYDAIVKPTAKSFQVGLGSEHLHAQIKDVCPKLNSVQKRSIVGISRACLGEPAVPKICLIQGPPGTGKSTTIGGLTLQMLYSGMKDRRRETMPRILIVAPSNAAVDEVAKKLLNLRKEIPESSRFNLVRMGVTGSMDSHVRKYSVDELVNRTVSEQVRAVKNIDSLQEDIEAKQRRANTLYQQKIEAENDGKEDLASKHSRDYKNLQRQIQNLKSEMKKPLNNREERELRRKAEHKILIDADVILTTMSSAEMVETYYFRVQNADTRRISVCIMDEASQCVEPEALIPLKLGFRKLVMVGDHEQLQATVISNSARQLDYQQSLFGRLIGSLSSSEERGVKSAGNTPPMKSGRSPVLRLATQYRMHPDIALWPNRYFYGGLLNNGDNPVKSGRLVPYLVLNVERQAENDRGNFYNRTEEAVIIDLVKAASKICGKTPRIGIITYYNRQKQNITLKLKNENLNNEDKIRVDTVDAFQGSERDVIFVSCVRGGSGGVGFLTDGQRLNVSLTRAVSSLVLVGNMTTLRSSCPAWRELVEDAQKRKLFYYYSASLNLGKLLKQTD